MKVACLYKFNNIRIEEVPIPEVNEGEALIRVHASGICSGDVMPWYIEKKAPLVLGHEPAGEVVKVGKGVTSLAPGDRVFVHHHAPCMSCSFCKRGDFVQCPTWNRSKIIPGGISEYILIPEINLKHDTLQLPDEITFEEATLIEPTACVVKSYHRSGIKKGDTVLIIGLGVMGVLHIMLAHQYGADRVIGADMVPYRLDMAKRLGANEVINVSESSLKEGIYSLTEGGGAEIVIVGPNNIQAMKEGLEVVAPGGTVVFFTPALPGEMLTIDPNRLYFKDINIVTSYSCGPDNTREAMLLIKNGLVRADKIITHRFSIDKTQEAYEIVARSENSLKVIIIF